MIPLMVNYVGIHTQYTSRSWSGYLSTSFYGQTYCRPRIALNTDDKLYIIVNTDGIIPLPWLNIKLYLKNYESVKKIPTPIKISRE